MSSRQGVESRDVLCPSVLVMGAWGEREHERADSPIFPQGTGVNRRCSRGNQVCNGPTQSPAEENAWIPNPVRGILLHKDTLDSCIWKLNLGLEEVEVLHHGKRYLLRTPLKGVCGKVLQGAGVAIPPPVREVKEEDPAAKAPSSIL